LLDKELPSPPLIEPVPDMIMEEMRQVERHLVQPLLAGESSPSMSAFRMGSTLADPFSDDFALDRSDTPKPPVPPKVELDQGMPDAHPMPGSFTAAPPAPQPEETAVNHEELTYEEQLAIALSLSEAESSGNGATVRQQQPDDHDAELKAAIAASLRDMDDQQAAHAIANAEPVTPQPRPVEYQPLVDLTPPSPRIVPARTSSRNWEAMFDHPQSPSQEPLNLTDPIADDESDELYRLTPQLTRARLATHDASNQSPSLATPSLSYDPVREAAGSHTMSPQPQPLMEASFYSAPSSVAAPSEKTFGRETPQLVDVPAPSHDTFETDSESETFASMSRSASVAPSHARSEISNVEVVDVAEDSDDDIMDGSGVLTPDSWTEVWSRDGESDVDEHEHVGPARSSL